MRVHVDVLPPEASNFFLAEAKRAELVLMSVPVIGGDIEYPLQLFYRERRSFFAASFGLSTNCATLRGR